MDWSIQEVARLAGTTSRALRHYGDVGLLTPSRVGANGYRRYDASSLVRLQRILLLRDLGLGLARIGEVLAERTDEHAALDGHLAWLRAEQERLTRQIASVETTMEALKRGDEPMVENMFDGFDHTEHREEVAERWGPDAYARGDEWWRSMSAAERTAWQERTAELAGDWVAAAESGASPESDRAQVLAERHVAWLAEIPGTPTAGSGQDAALYIRGLGEMYVADPRFARNYTTSQGGSAGAEFVRDALVVYAGRRL